MAWLIRNRVGMYYVAWREADRKVYYQQAGTNKRKALELRDELAHRLRLGRVGGGVVPEKIGFEDYGRKWLAVRTVRPTSRKRDEGAFENHLLPTFGGKLLGSITKELVDELAAKITKASSRHNARRVLAVLSKMMSDAIENNYLQKNPVRVPPPPERIREEVSVESFCRIVKDMPLRWRPFVFVGLLTGLRWGELAALQWEDIDFDAGKIYVRRQKNSHLYGPEAQALKTDGSHRAVDMLPPVRRILMDLPQRPKLVFPGVRGGYLSYGLFQKAWRPIVTDLGLGVNFHGLRHGFGSLLLVWGEPLIYVSQQLGHSSTTLTHTTYLHLMKEGRRLDKDAVLAMLEAAFRGELAYTGLTRTATTESAKIKTLENPRKTA